MLFWPNNRTALAAGDHERADAILGEVEEISQSTGRPWNVWRGSSTPGRATLFCLCLPLANAGIELLGDTFGPSGIQQCNDRGFRWTVSREARWNTLFPWVASRLGIVELPQAITWMHVAGVALVGGIGFTVAIFVTGLAFDDHTLVDNGKMGILAASLVAGLVGYGVLRLASEARQRYT